MLRPRAGGVTASDEAAAWLQGETGQPMTRVVETLIERHHPGSRLHLSGSPLVQLPDHVREAVDAAAAVPGYAPSGGEPSLREAIAASLEARGVRVLPEQVVVTCGAMHALDLVFRSVLQPGDEVLMPAPGFFIGGLARQVGARVAWFPSPVSARFRPSWAAAEAAVTSRTRILYVNTPVNPTGYVYDDTDVRAAADLAARTGLMLVSDESLSRFVYGGRRHLSPAAADPQLRSVLVGSFSKDYAMPGMRVGYAVLPPELVGRVSALLEWSMLAVSRPAQAAALAALTGPGDWLDAMAAAAAERGSRAARELAAIAGLSCIPPRGGLNLFPRFAGDAEGLARDLIVRFGVPVCPGPAFGCAGYFRLQFGGAWQDLQLALRYIEDAAARRSSPQARRNKCT
jgi:aspartate/methionine/tyrosine aminotransferase